MSDAAIIGTINHRHNLVSTQIVRLDAQHHVILVVARTRNEDIGVADPLFFKVLTPPCVTVNNGGSLKNSRQNLTASLIGLQHHHLVAFSFQRSSQLQSSLATAGDHDSFRFRRATFKQRSDDFDIFGTAEHGHLVANLQLVVGSRNPETFLSLDHPHPNVRR